MQQEPRGNALLECARELFRNRLLPTVPAEHRHAALMIMNAMAIAARQFGAGEEDGIGVEERAGLQALLMDEYEARDSGNRRLAEMIRTGAGDPGQPKRTVILAHLRRVARQRLAECNPKILNAGDR